MPSMLTSLACHLLMQSIPTRGPGVMMSRPSRLRCPLIQFLDETLASSPFALLALDVQIVLILDIEYGHVRVQVGGLGLLGQQGVFEDAVAEQRFCVLALLAGNDVLSLQVGASHL